MCFKEMVLINQDSTKAFIEKKGETIMSTYYEKWIGQEESRAAEIDAMRKAKTWVYAAVTFVLCIVFVSGIGFLGGGVAGGIQNIMYGAILGIISVGIFLIVMLCSNYKKRYMKQLEKEVRKELTTDALKEDFAKAMLDASAESCLEFVWQKGAVPERFCVVSGFAVLRGTLPCIVQLEKTERMELDVLNTQTTSYIGDYKVRSSYSSYPIYFFYHQSGMANPAKQKIDKLISFPSRELRSQALAMIQEKAQTIKIPDSNMAKID